MNVLASRLEPSLRSFEHVYLAGWWPGRTKLGQVACITDTLKFMRRFETELASFIHLCDRGTAAMYQCFHIQISTT